MADFEDRYYRRSRAFSGRRNTRDFSQRDFTKFSGKYYERRSNHESESTLCVPNRYNYNSKSTLSMPPLKKAETKSTLCPPFQEEYKHLERNISNKNISNLPYYIVPVLYVPHKPLYEAKQMIEPHMYKAYHCKSKRQLPKKEESIQKMKNSKSSSNIFSSSRSKTKKEFENIYESPRNKNKEDYSFEDFDEYFRNYIDAKKSSSEISFCTENSYTQVTSTPKRSGIFKNEHLCDADNFEKRREISKEFPELFGVYSVHGGDCPEKIRPKTRQEEPTWDSPRTMDAFIATDDLKYKNCISAQTSFVTLATKTRTTKDSQGTQTVIKDIKKNVLVIPHEKLNRPIKRVIIGTEVSGSSFDDKNKLVASFSNGQLNEVEKGMTVCSRNASKSAMCKLHKSGVSNLCMLSRKNSGKSVSSATTNI